MFIGDKMIREYKKYKYLLVTLLFTVYVILPSHIYAIEVIGYI